MVSTVTRSRPFGRAASGPALCTERDTTALFSLKTGPGVTLGAVVVRRSSKVATMSRRGQTVLIGAVMVLGFAIGAAFMPVPYVALGPGQTVNVLGTVGSTPVIKVTGAPVSQSTGQLRLTTVGVYSKLDLATAMRFWADRDTAVVPRDYVYPPGTSPSAVEKQEKEAFAESQSTAETAALRALGYDEGATPPFQLEFDLAGIGGPSAGLLFALGIVDKLKPEDLTGGSIVAGTGSLDSSGEVGPIGGISQKLLGARADGATVFLTPAGNCEAATKHPPAGLRLVKVSTLDGALAALRTLRDGGGVPEC
ncbi:MAG: YlbL family protein [Mycobacteriales bacterium]